MTCFLKFFSCFLVVNLATGSPFGEFSLKKNFNFEFKPFPFKPIHFIKEKWSPFGIYGVHHGIEKRDLNKITLAGEKPVLEHSLPVEVHEVEQLGPVTFSKQELGRVPIMQPPIQPPMQLHMQPQIQPHIQPPIQPHMQPPIQRHTEPPIQPNWLDQFEYHGVGPVPASPPPEVVIAPPPPKVQPIPGFHTNIARDQVIDNYLKVVGPEEPLPHEEYNSIEKPVHPTMALPFNVTFSKQELGRVPIMQPPIQPPMQLHMQPQIQPHIQPPIQPHVQPPIQPHIQPPIQPNWMDQFEYHGVGPVPASPPPDVVIAPPPPKVQPIPGFHTSIPRDKVIDSYMKVVGPEEPLPHEEYNSIEKPVHPTMEEPGEKEDNPFVRGSKLAIYFGSLFIDIMSRFLGRPVAPVVE